MRKHFSRTRTLHAHPLALQGFPCRCAPCDGKRRRFGSGPRGCHAQPIDVTGLAPLKEGEWLTQNPYSGDPKAIEIGASGYNQNCARCHGLQVVSGGLAPDLRYLEKGQVGDEWFIERIRHGAHKSDGSTVMPPFEGVFTQEAMWAIRSYVESMHSDE